MNEVSAPSHASPGAGSLPSTIVVRSVGERPVRLVDELTDTQREMLAFFAGLIRWPPERWNSGTYLALSRRELIERGENYRWRVTELGETTAQELLS